MKLTPYTAQARKRAKSLLADHKAGNIQIWKTNKGFQVVTFERPGNTYTSDPFATAILAFRHILCRAANTGNDMMRFKAIAEKYAARYGVATR
jgi:hypothetical protein